MAGIMAYKVIVISQKIFAHFKIALITSLVIV
jgi:hypothetical protein